jgi:hypothetical protein
MSVLIKIYAFIFLNLMLIVNAQAAFLDGLEGFNGKVKDTGTWMEFQLNPGPTRVIQNDNVTLDFGGTEYKTNTLTVGVGQTVSIELLNINEVNDPIGAQEVAIYLTTNDGDWGVYFDSHFLFVRYAYSWGQYQFDGGYGGGGHASGTIFGRNTPKPMFQSYVTMEIQRTSSTQAVFRARRMDGTLIEQKTSTFTGMPNDLYICLTAWGSWSCTYDNLKITNPLWPSACTQRPAGDLDGDCQVDMYDFAMLAKSWLTCGRVSHDCE